MQTLIVYCHPEPCSFNNAMKERAADTLKRLGHTVVVSDLYAENFDPVERPGHYTERADAERFFPLTEQRHAFTHGALAPEVKREIARLEAADLIILQFPLWWHAQPAMLKGWFDRVFVYGGMYSGQMRFDQGRFRAKRVICSVTTGAPASTFAANGRSGQIERLLWPINYSLYYLGMQVLPPNLVYGVQGGGLQYLQQSELADYLRNALDAWEERLIGLNGETAIPFAGWSDWDESGALKAGHPDRWR